MRHLAAAPVAALHSPGRPAHLPEALNRRWKKDDSSFQAPNSSLFSHVVISETLRFFTFHFPGKLRSSVCVCHSVCLAWNLAFFFTGFLRHIPPVSFKSLEFVEFLNTKYGVDCNCCCFSNSFPAGIVLIVSISASLNDINCVFGLNCGCLPLRLDGFGNPICPSSRGLLPSFGCRTQLRGSGFRQPYCRTMFYSQLGARTVVAVFRVRQLPPSHEKCKRFGRVS